MTAHFEGDKNVSLEGSRMRGSVEICHREFLKILCTLEESIRVRFNSIIRNPVIKSAAVFLDTKSYCCVDIEEPLKAASVSVESFELLLEANGFNSDALSTEINLLHTHVVRFLTNCSPDKCWQRLFKLKETLGIKNVLHLAGTSLVIPISNAEAERVYSFLWIVYTKERTRLYNSTLEDILRVRGGRDFSDEKYEKAIVIYDKETRWYREKTYKTASGTQISIKQKDNEKNVTDITSFCSLRIGGK